MTMITVDDDYDNDDHDHDHDDYDDDDDDVDVEDDDDTDKLILVVLVGFYIKRSNKSLDDYKRLNFENKLALFVLLRMLMSLYVSPSHICSTHFTGYILHCIFAGHHCPLFYGGPSYVDHILK
jgi:hypothetical protein